MKRVMRTELKRLFKKRLFEGLLPPSDRQHTCGCFQALVTLSPDAAQDWPGEKARVHAGHDFQMCRAGVASFPVKSHLL